MRTLFFLLVLLAVNNCCLSQAGNYASYTVNEGLPSNHVYDCVEDDYGFLWIATDAGIARFDGRFFQVFTTENGLPDNEVLQVAKDKEGRIWINCFRQSPAYFDHTRNRFINATEDTSLAKISGTANMYMYALSDGGITYLNEKGTFIFRNKQLIHYKGLLVKENSDGSFIVLSHLNSFPGQQVRTYLSHVRNGKVIDSVFFSGIYEMRSYMLYSDNDAYLFNSADGKCHVISNIQTDPLRFKLDSLTLPEAFFSIGYTKDYFYIISNTATVYVFDTKSITPKRIVKGNYIPNRFYEDKRGNSWVPTVDKGLLVYRKKPLGELALPAGFSRTNFLSITKEPNGRLIAGNYYGEVIEVNKNKTTVHRVIRKTPSRQRKILVKGRDVYTVSEDGVYKNYSMPVLNINGFTAAGKTAMIYDDSTIILGAFAGLMLIDTRSNKVTAVNRYKRVTSITRGLNATIYLGSTDGMYKYDMATHINTSLNDYISERVTGVYFTKDSLLWVATSSKGIVVMKNEKPIATITMQKGIISNFCRSIEAGRDRQIWLGTSQGISVINYTLQGNQLSYTINNLSVNDGLTNNEINEMCFSNDTMFVATGNGISIVPANLSTPSFSIPVHLTAMSINQKDTIITSSYQLNSKEQNIQMQFAAIELDGHFKHFEYSLNGSGWSYLSGRTLTLQLNSGKHHLQVRAVDVHGHISTNALSVHFNIATPFWKKIWFWVLIIIVFQAIVLYLINRWQKERKEIMLSKEIAVAQTASLEQQAFTSLMNPHFIFNALNSIQHYINLQDRQKANRYLSDFASLIRKNFEASQQSFISLEQELENIRIYLRLEQMRFAERFSYHIIVDEQVDTEKWMIPTMMLQPLLENAILHGLMPSPTSGELKIGFACPANDLLITITDNGIGIKQSFAAKQSNGHKSHGMELIRKRMNALGKLAGSAISIEMSPAFDDAINPGNRIQLKIPSDLYEAWLKATSAFARR